MRGIDSPNASTNTIGLGFVPIKPSVVLLDDDSASGSGSDTGSRGETQGDAHTALLPFALRGLGSRSSTRDEPGRGPAGRRTTPGADEHPDEHPDDADVHDTHDTLAAPPPPPPRVAQARHAGGSSPSTRLLDLVVRRLEAMPINEARRFTALIEALLRDRGLLGTDPPHTTRSTPMRPLPLPLPLPLPTPSLLSLPPALPFVPAVARPQPLALSPVDRHPALGRLIAVAELPRGRSLNEHQLYYILTTGTMHLDHACQAALQTLQDMGILGALPGGSWMRTDIQQAPSVLRNYFVSLLGGRPAAGSMARNQDRLAVERVLSAEDWPGRKRRKPDQ